MNNTTVKFLVSEIEDDICDCIILFKEKYICLQATESNGFVSIPVTALL